MLIAKHENTVFLLVNKEMEAFEQTQSYLKVMYVFVKIPLIGTVANNLKTENEILQQNILIHLR